jgi:SAM-dependent methyltransferase
MSFDPAEHRESSLESWEAAASGWRRQQELVRAFTAPVSQWMLDALALVGGERVLELAAGLGDTGLLAAELVAPDGSVIISDQAEAMLAGARARAAELGIGNVEFKVLNAEWIDLPVASVDAVLCRWGYMLMADPVASLAETRRVLKAGGRLALAVWDAIEHNPWAAVPGSVLVERDLLTPPARSRPDGDGEEASRAAWESPFITGAPGPFALGSRERVRALLEDAGFTDVQIDAIELTRRQGSFEEMWETTLDISPSFHDTVLSQPAAEIDEIKAAVAERFAPFTAADGSLEVPGRTLLASASA